MSNPEYDDFIFIEQSALKPGTDFQAKCMCGGTIRLTPPLKFQRVICVHCHASILPQIVNTSVGFVVLPNDTTGEPDLAPVQGNGAKTPDQLTAKERAEILLKYREQVSKRR